MAAFEPVLARTTPQQVVVSAAIELVLPLCAADMVVAVTAIDDIPRLLPVKPVVTGAAQKRIAAFATNEAIIIAPPVQHVIAAPAEKRIVAGQTLQAVFTAGAGENIPAGAATGVFDALQRVGPPEPVNGRSGTELYRHAQSAGRKDMAGIADPIAARLPAQCVLAEPAHQRVVAIAAGEEIIAVAAVKAVIAIRADQRIRPGPAPDRIVARPAVAKVVAVFAVDEVRGGIQPYRVARRCPDDTLDRPEPRRQPAGIIGQRQVEPERGADAGKIDDIKAKTAIELVVAAAADKHIVTFKPDEEFILGASHKCLVQVGSMMHRLGNAACDRKAGDVEKARRREILRQQRPAVRRQDGQDLLPVAERRTGRGRRDDQVTDIAQIGPAGQVDPVLAPFEIHDDIIDPVLDQHERIGTAAAQQVVAAGAVAQDIGPGPARQRGIAGQLDEDIVLRGAGQRRTGAGQGQTLIAQVDAEHRHPRLELRGDERPAIRCP